MYYTSVIPDFSEFYIKNEKGKTRLHIELLPKENIIYLHQDNETIKTEFESLEKLIEVLEDCKSLIREQRKLDND